MDGLGFNPLPSGMVREEFVRAFGGVYEHSPWIAEQAWDQGLTQEHDSVSGLAKHMSGIVDSATNKQQLDLICAHPDLAGKAAQAGTLTDESNSEQAGAGIDRCSPQEFQRFQQYNEAYREKFDFPFIMAVKGSNRHQILAAFAERLPNSYQAEFKQALDQIHKIARFRFADIARKPDNPE